MTYVPLVLRNDKDTQFLLRTFKVPTDLPPLFSVTDLLSIGENERFMRAMARAGVERRRAMSIPVQAGEATAMLEELGNTGLDFWQQIRWERSSGVIFELDAALAHAFLDTEVRVTGADILMPVPTFFLALPPGLLQMPVNGEGEEPVSIDGVYVSHVINDEKGPPQIWCSMSVLLPDPKDQGRVVTGTQHWKLPLDVPGSYEDWFLGDIATPDGCSPEASLRLSRMVLRLVLNTILYITSEDADVKPDFIVPAWVSAEAAKRSRKMGERLKKQHAASNVRYSKVGHNLHFDPNLVAAGQASGEARSLTRRFIVRGHWRMQAHGEGRKQRKALWIKPHWKGPEWSEIISGAGVRKVG